MSTLDTDSRNAGLDAINAELNDGGGTNATYEYGDAGFSTVLVSWNLDATNPFTTAGSTTTGTAELTGQPITASGLATGTAAEYQIKDKAGTVRRSGTLASTVSITSGSSYGLSADVTLPAS